MTIGAFVALHQSWILGKRNFYLPGVVLQKDEVIWVALTPGLQRDEVIWVALNVGPWTFGWEISWATRRRRTQKRIQNCLDERKLSMVLGPQLVWFG